MNQGFWISVFVSKLSNLESVSRGGSRAVETSKMECFVEAVNYYNKALHLGCCSSPRSASGQYCSILNKYLFCKQQQWSCFELLLFSLTLPSLTIVEVVPMDWFIGCLRIVFRLLQFFLCFYKTSNDRHLYLKINTQQFLCAIKRESLSRDVETKTFEWSPLDVKV